MNIKLLFVEQVSVNIIIFLLLVYIPEVFFSQNRSVLPHFHIKHEIVNKVTINAM